MAVIAVGALLVAAAAAPSPPMHRPVRAYGAGRGRVPALDHPPLDGAALRDGGLGAIVDGAMSSIAGIFGQAEASRCMAPSMEAAMHVAISACDAAGSRSVETTYRAQGTKHCDIRLDHPHPPSCTQECGPGSALLWQAATRTFECTECPAGYFSVGGGHIQQRWPRLPREFSTTCFSMDPDKVATGQQTWREGEGCEGWSVNANGSAIISGNNSGLDYVESYLILHLRFVRPGELWFTFRVDAEEFADGLLFRLDDVAQPLAGEGLTLISRSLEARKVCFGLVWGFGFRV